MMQSGIIVLFFILGLIIGSFLNVAVIRMHARKTLRGRSQCLVCQTQIAWYDNIPLVSFLFLCARCRKCRARILWQYPLTELVTGIGFALVYYYHGATIFSLVYGLGVFSVLVFLFLYDYLYQEIPDSVSIPAILVFFVVGSLGPWHGWQSMVFGAVVAGGFFFLQFVVSRGRWIGGGDIRLGVLMGVTLGWPIILVAFLIAYVIGALVSGVLLLMKKKTMKSEVPFGTYLTLATFVCLLWGEGILSWYLQLLY